MDKPKQNNRIQPTGGPGQPDLNSPEKKGQNSPKASKGQKPNNANLAPMAAQKGVETNKGKAAPFGNEKKNQNGKKEIVDTLSQDHKRTESGKERAGKESSAGPDWREKLDRIHIYSMQKNFTFEAVVAQQKKEQTIWKQQDIKGKKRQVYIKTVQKANDTILKVVEQTRLEKNANYEDRWPLLNFRKDLMKVRIYINMAAKRIMTHKVFETICIGIIMFNSVSLATEDPLQVQASQMSEIIEKVFLGLYTVEMCIKILGLGFLLNKGAYIRDPWNILDFTIVMSAYLSLMQAAPDQDPTIAINLDADSTGGGFSLNALRAFRVLRPLKAVTAIKGLRVLVLSVLKAFPLLKDTMIVLFFFFLIFSIAGTQLFGGIALQTCVNIETGMNDNDTCTQPTNTCGGMYSCPPGYFCGKQAQNPNYGVTNFDNILYSFLGVFQIISLEGWSDNMIIYEQGFTLYVLYYFFMVVLLGAYFLLNLTLAVINTSFGSTHEYYKHLADVAKEKARKNKLRASTQSEDAFIEFDPDDWINKEIGINEFFIAKRAAKKMQEFTKIKKEERILREKEEELQRKNAEEEEENVQAGDNTPQQPQKLQDKSTKKDGKSASAEKTAKTIPPSQLKKDEKIEQQEKDEDVISQEENHEQVVMKFLVDINAEDEVRPPTKKFGDRTNSVQMALNDNRRADQAQKKKNISDIRTVNDNKPKKQQPSEFYSQNLTDGSRFDDLLDIERVIGNQPDYQNKDKADSGEHPFDLSFISGKNGDYPDFSDSDDQKKKKKKRERSFDVLSESAIESDGSLKDNIDYHRTEKKRKAEAKNKAAAPEINPAKNAIMKDIQKRFKRILTTDFQKKDPMNESVSTFYGNGKESLKPTHDMASMGGLTQIEMNQQKQRLESALSQQPTPAKPQVALGQDKDHQKLKQFRERITNVDETFLKSNKPKDPNEFIDKKTQKIEISKGVFYRSTSADEVFEARNQLADVQAISKANQYVKLIEKTKDDLKVDEDFNRYYIRPAWQAYQLKTRYDITNNEQVDFESDDEEALVLALQPFDTVMNVGYGQLLSHLPTKFVARLSEIIVSSTISITLIPADPIYRVKDLGKLQPQEEQEWVDLRSEFRASQIHTISFRDQYQNSRLDETIGSKKSVMTDGGKESRKDSNKQDQDEQSEGEANAMDGNNQDVQEQEDKLVIMNLQRKLIPPNLLSKPLPAAQILMLNEEEKRSYNIQKNKYEASQKKVTKMPTHPTVRRFTIEEAQKMALGTFHNLEDEDENVQDPSYIKLNLMKYLGRNDYFHDQKMENFEKLEVNFTQPAESRFDYSKISGDNIPESLKSELNLPEDLENNEINFEEVRKKDCNIKRKIVLWSGQDVLDVGITPEQSQLITSKLTKVRVWPKGFARILKMIRITLRQLVRLNIWDSFMTGCVMLNTIQMAMQRYNVPIEEQIFMEKLNAVFTWIFIVEMSVKICAIGPKKYVGDKMNWLDGSVVSLSIFEMLMAVATGSGGNVNAFKTIRIFRTFRVLRVVRLLRALHSMQIIIQVIQKSASSFAYITMLMYVFIFIFTLLGMQLFGGQLKFADGVPRGNYDSFNIAFVTAFQILTMENWNSVLFDSMRSPTINILIPPFYYIIWMSIGNFVLLNLFLAILLDSFLTEDDVDEEDALERERQEAIAKRTKIQQEKERRIKKLGPGMMKSGKFSTFTAEEKEILKLEKAKKSIFSISKIPDIIVDNIDDLDEKMIEAIFQDCGIIKKKDPAREASLMFFDVQCENSIYLFSKKNKCRIFMYKMYKHKVFDNFIMAVIGMSSIKLAVDTYLSSYAEDSLPGKISSGVDLFMNVVFYIECTAKIISMGFVMDQGAYVRDGWNQLDFFIVCTSIMDLALANIELPVLKILRLLRTLRPLRVISHNVAMKLIVSSLFESVGAIVNVVVVIVCVWLMFSILAVNLYAGKSFRCSASKYSMASKYDCNMIGGSWIRFVSNYDDILQAMLTMFVVSSLEGWPDVMYANVDQTAVDKGPKKEFTPANAYFYQLFILIGSFFLLNFFIGVLFLKYTVAQVREKKGYTQANLNWIDIQKMIVKSECPFEIKHMPPHSNVLGRKIYRLINSNPFDLFIMGTICLNIVQMAIGFEGQPASITLFLDLTNYVFSAIFVVEMILKFITYGKHYFKTNWNKFDFFIVMSSIIDILMSNMPSNGASNNPALQAGPQLVRIMRVLRVTRILRLAGKNQGLMALIQTITMSIGALANVFLLLMLVLFIFSVLGVFFFGTVTTGIWTINSYKNFTNWHLSFITLYIIATGENWPLQMVDMQNTPPNCIDGVSCGTSYSPVFYIFFVIMVQNVMLNLFILVIIQQFEQYYVSDDNPIQKFKDNASLFLKVWIDFTSVQYKCVKIREKNLYQFFKTLPLPIGLPPETTEAEMKKTMIKMGIRCDDGYIYYNELLYRCMRRCYGDFKLNKRMYIIELKTMFKIMQKTLLAQNQQHQKKQHELFFERMIGTDTAVNPFLQMMYYKISYKTWVKAMRSAQLRKKHEEIMETEKIKAEKLGMPFFYQPFEEEKIKMINVEIQEEEEVILTSEEDSEDDVEQESSQGAPLQIKQSSRDNKRRQSITKPPGSSQKKQRDKSSALRMIQGRKE